MESGNMGKMVKVYAEARKRVTKIELQDLEMKENVAYGPS